MLFFSSGEYTCIYTDQESEWLTFTTLLANSVDDKLLIFFLFFPENRFWYFMQIVSFWDSLHEISKIVFWETRNQLFLVSSLWLVHLIFQEPAISSIKPVIGPVSGGSMITIYGEHLDTGRTITASVGREECFILRWVMAWAQLFKASLA